VSSTRAATATLVILLTLATAGCSRSGRCNGHGDIQVALDSIVGDRQRSGFELREVTDFEWSGLDAFDEYTPVEIVEARTGLKYREAWWQDIYTRESHTLLVFSDEMSPVCYVEIKNSKARAATWSFGRSMFQEDRIPAADANFEVSRRGELPVAELRSHGSRRERPR